MCILMHCMGRLICRLGHSSSTIWAVGMLLMLLLWYLPNDELHAQNPATEAQDYIEDFINNLDEESTDNIEFVIQLLEDLQRQPINLRKSDMTPLAEAGLITNEQLLAYQEHVRSVGPLISVYELQGIKGWDLATIRRITPLVVVNRDLDQLYAQPGSLLSESNFTIRSMISRRYPSSSGYKIKDGAESPAYEGDPWRHLMVIRAQYNYQFSVGISAEKDEGESFFRGSNDSYDYLSFHAYGRNVTRHIKAIALGDYKVNFGQGLIMHNGFGGSKSGYVTQVKKGGYLFRPHTSISEINYFRGAAVELAMNDRFSLGLFYSNHNEDVNLQIDTSDSEVEIIEFTSLQTSGLHRTMSERSDEKQLEYRALGGRLGFESPGISLHINALNSRFGGNLERRFQPYNQFRFTGNELTNVSLDYAITWRGVHLFGESAYSDNDVLAHLLGLKTALNKHIDAIFVYRKYPRDYLTVRANSFGETRNAENEEGIYAGLEYNISPKFQLSGYADFWTNDWLRFNVDAPSRGQEYLFKFRYYKKRRLETYAQYRYENKAVNLNLQDDSHDGIQQRIRNQLRCHLNYKLSKAIEWRSRVELHHVQFADHSSLGYLMFQDLIFKPILSPFSFTCRYALFDTEDYDSRIYAYENNLLYNYSLPPLYNTGHRFYINLRFRPYKPLTLELRYAHTLLSDQDETGSGTELRASNVVRQVAFQAQYVF